MRRRTRIWAGAVVLVAVVAGAVVVATGTEPTTAAAPRPTASTVEVQQGDLSSMVSLNGTLTRRARVDGSPYSAVNQASGIYTRLPTEGDAVQCGDVLYRVDDEPVLLLCGWLPAYRDLEIGDEGRDVRQLNRDLHLPGEGDEFTWRTERGLEKVRRDRGGDETGKLDLGDAVVLPRSVRISRVTAKLGGSARPGAEVAQGTSDALEVEVDLDASQQGEVRQGDRARITLPGNRSAAGRVRRLAKVARTPGEDDDVAAATIAASISLDEPKQARGLDRAPVRVQITTRGVKNVLSVPVLALVGRSGGGYAVEVVRAGGRRELVAVRLGLFDTADGRVEVKGALREDDDVVVPAS